MCLGAGGACFRQANPAPLYDSATKLFQQGEYEAAQQNAARGYEEFRKQTRSEWYWKFRLLLAEVDLFAGWRGESAEVDKLLAQAPPAEFRDAAVRYRILRGYSLFRAKKVREAETALETAAAQAHQIGAYELEADAENLLGSRATTNDRDDTALHKALQIASERHLPYQQAAAWLNLGVRQYQRDLYGDAIPYFEHAAELARRIGFKQVNSLATVNAAACYREVGDADRALKIHEDVVRAEEKSGVPSTLINAYIDLGTSYLIEQDTTRGIECLRKAVRIAKASDLPVQFVDSASSLAQALESSGRLDEAEHYNGLAFQTCDKKNQRQLAELTLTKAAIAERRGRHGEAIAAFRQAIDMGGGVPAVLWEAHAGLGSVYSGTGDIDDARIHFEQALRVIEQNRADQLKRDYEITFLATLIRFYQRYVSVLMANGDVNAAIEVADSSRANVLTRSVTAAGTVRSGRLVEHMQHQARVTGNVFLFYWLAPARSYLWVLTGDGVKTVELPDEQTIAQDVDSYLSLVVNEKRDPLTGSNGPGKRLYDTLISPTNGWLPRGAKVVIVPDGALHNLNFEMLVNDAPEAHYWIQDAVVSVAPSLSILQAGGETRASAERALLLFGDPEPAPGYPKLPQAAAEVTNVERHFPAGRTALYQGAAATVEHYRGADPKKFANIHFAAHAEPNQQSPLDSAIILTPRPDGYKLYARDVMAIPLTANLVTISACRAAGARAYSGEGLVGFAWAFFQAGARNIVTSLWDVNDTTTAELMERFYARMQAGEPYAEALREAKLSMLATGTRKPYYWAPFQLYTRVVRSTNVRR